MAVDRAKIRAFLNASPRRKMIGDTLESAGLHISWVGEEAPEIWCLYLQPDTKIRQLFGTRQEILVWVVEFDRFSAKSVSQADEHIRANQPRLCQDFAIIILNVNNAGEIVNDVAEPLATSFIGFSIVELPRFAPLGHADYVLELQRRLYSKDLYRRSTALTDPTTFYGRDGIHNEIIRTLTVDATNVGVFGLRKSGKTSLLYRVLNSIRNKNSILAGHIDVQRLDAINPTADYFLWSLGEALADANSQVRRIAPLRLFGKHNLFSDAPRGDIVELFDHDMRALVSGTNKKIVFFLDEIELMSPDTPGSQWGNSFVHVWRLLRGLYQQFPGRFAYFITGTNPKCVESNKLGHIENPAYNYFDVRFLQPLRQQEGVALLEELGDRMGLDWTQEASNRLYSLTGGHPFLLRAFASTVHQLLSPRSGRKEVTPQTITSGLDHFFMSYNPHLTQMVEVLEEFYPDEYHLLELLSKGHVGEFRSLGHAFPEAVAHLRGYALVSEQVSECRIGIEVLQTWFQRRLKARDTAHTYAEASTLPQGTLVQGYEIISCVGSGGFAKVYKAKAKGDSDSGLFVALKVIDDGRLGFLQREMEVLQDAVHPNIVRFREIGKTENGLVYLVMDYVEGTDLVRFCERASRLPPDQAATLMLRLTEALESLHPDEERVDQLRKKTTLTVAEHRELITARHGFVHRDINPRNIMLMQNGTPVLIDFNISCRVYSEARTTSGSRGYFPPDGVPMEWTPDIDRYQLGLTMLQVSTGIHFDAEPPPNGNIDDLRQVAVEELPQGFSEILLRATSGQRQARFQSTSALRKALSKLQGTK